MNETKKHLQRRDINSILLNITWLTSICPDDQMICNGHFETKCYTKEQRCDGKFNPVFFFIKIHLFIYLKKVFGIV